MRRKLKSKSREPLRVPLSEEVKSIQDSLKLLETVLQQAKQLQINQLRLLRTPTTADSSNALGGRGTLMDVDSVMNRLEAIQPSIRRATTALTSLISELGEVLGAVDILIKLAHKNKTEEPFSSTKAEDYSPGQSLLDDIAPDWPKTIEPVELNEPPVDIKWVFPKSSALLKGEGLLFNMSEVEEEEDSGGKI